MKKILSVLLIALVAFTCFVSCEEYAEEADDGVVITLKAFSPLYLKDTTTEQTVESIVFKNAEGKTLGELLDSVTNSVKIPGGTEVELKSTNDYFWFFYNEDGSDFETSGITMTTSFTESVTVYVSTM